MVLAAKQENCLSEVLVIAAALSVQDPRDRPLEKQGSADAAHLQFQDERSDFLSFLKMWAFFDDALKHRKSNRKLAEACREHFLSFPRLREWRDIHGQLHALVAEMGLRPNEKPATYEQVHRALLTGLLGNIGTKGDEPGEYVGARGIKFRDPPRLRHEEAAAEMADGGGAGRDHAPLCAARRPHRAGVDRAGGRAPREARVL